MRRRGVAMLLVLGAAVLLLAAASVIARTRATRSLADGANSALTMAWAACDGAEPAVVEWLRRESRDVLLDPRTPAPNLTILHESFTTEGDRVTITITVWDQCGMVPTIDVDGLPSLREFVDRQGFSDRTDLLTAAPGLDLVRDDAFPSIDRAVALGGLCGTHNPAPGSDRRRGGSIPVLNVNTAPEAILRAVFADLQLDGVDRVLSARAAGEQAVVSGLQTGRTVSVHLAGSSTCWGVRTDVTVSGTGRRASASLWSVYTLRGGTWSREQRLVIPR